MAAAASFLPDTASGKEGQLAREDIWNIRGLERLERYLGNPVIHAPSQLGGMEVPLGFTPKDGAGRHKLQQGVDCRRREAHDIAVLPIIPTREMHLLPHLRLLLDKPSNDVVHRHLQLEATLDIRQGWRVR
jgi:hypothetical protein